MSAALGNTIPTCVTFDQQGVFGPAATILFSPDLNEKSLKEVTKLLKANYENLSSGNVKPRHREECYTFLAHRAEKVKDLSPSKIIRTAFFEQMQSKEPSSLHDRVVTILVPAMLQQAKPFLPTAVNTYHNQDKINEWLARFLESYLSQEQLKGHCDYHEATKNNPEIKGTRTAIGMDLYSKCQEKQLTELDLDAILKGISADPEGYLENVDNAEVVQSFVERYTALFSMAEEKSQAVADSIRDGIATTFRQKFFPTTSH